MWLSPVLVTPKGGQDDTAFLMMTLAKLWASEGLNTWDDFYGEETRHRLALPTYPFEQQSHWLEAQPAEKRSVFEGKKHDITEVVLCPNLEKLYTPG